MERLDIHMVPCRIQFGDRGYLDKVSNTTDEFYFEFKNNRHHPTTSQPAPGDFRGQFQFLATECADAGLSIDATLHIVQGQVEMTRAFALWVPALVFTADRVR